MIRVTVELVSAIHPDRSRILGVAEIANDNVTSAATDGARGSYTVKLSKWAPKLDQTWKRARVEDFDRERRGPWDLLFLALQACVGSRNQDAAPAAAAPRKATRS